MSPNYNARLAQALESLRTVPAEELRSHRDEVLSTFRKLESLMGDPLVSVSLSHNLFSTALNVIDTSSFPLNAQISTTCSTHQRSTPPPAACHLSSTDTSSSSSSSQASAASSTHRGHQGSSPPSASSYESSSSSVAKLVQALNKESGQIKDFILGSEFEATGDELDRLNEDPRIVDLQLRNGLSSSLKARFRKGLGRRSLALEYNSWEGRTHNTSRVGELAGDSLVSRRDGHIEEYVKDNAHRFKNQQSAKIGIIDGIKMLVFERRLGRMAISAIVCFKSRRFQKVKYTELGSLVTMMNETKWIEELIKHKADWFDGCQNQYDAWCTEMSRRAGPSPGRKRRRLDQAVAPSRSPQRTESHESLRSAAENPQSHESQWVGEGADYSGSATNILSAAAQAEAATSPSIIHGSPMRTDISRSDPMRCEPSPVIPPLAPQDNWTYQQDQYDFEAWAQAFLISQNNSEHQYDQFNFEVFRRANPLLAPQDTSTYQQDPYDSEAWTQACLLSQNDSGHQYDQFNFEVFRRANPLLAPQDISTYQQDQHDLTTSTRENHFRASQENSTYQCEFATRPHAGPFSHPSDTMPLRFEAVPDAFSPVFAQPPCINV